MPKRSTMSRPALPARTGTRGWTRTSRNTPSRISSFQTSEGGRSESEAEDIRAGGDGNVLLAPETERHRRRFHPNVGRELPEGFAVPLIHGREAAVGLPVKDQAARRCEHTRPGLGTRRPGLRNFPNRFAGLDVQGAKKSLPSLIGVAGRLADAFFERHDIVQARDRGECG